MSEAGRRKTVEVFGKPLSPAEVVEQICSDVRTQGLSAVLRYTAKLDGAELTAETLRVPASELAAAHAKVSPDFLGTIRRIRENILRFQTAILHRDVEVDGPKRQQVAATVFAAGARGDLRAGRCGRLSVDGVDDGGARAGGGREGCCRRVAADAERRVQRRRAGDVS